MSAATVYLVGAGPGDAGLLTARGRDLLDRADAVVYDYLIPSELLHEIPDAAEHIYMGKKGFSPHATQEEINALLVNLARDVGARGGSCVVRLKGGDPCLFGRGGAEALALADAGVPFEIIPGVTSGIAAPAYAGIPVTHRGLASSVTFVTGHEDPQKGESAVDWDALAHLVRAGGTACVYMGMRDLKLVSERLRRAGLRDDFPVALVQWGTTAQQQTLISTLLEVEQSACEAGIGAPAIIVVGEVVALRGRLSWFETRPLFGRRVVVTRPRTKANKLTAQLRELGAEVVEFPAIEIAPPTSYRELDEAIAKIGRYDWVAFTSASGVDAFFERLDGDARRLGSTLVAAIGPATAARLAEFGVRADAMPDEYRSEAMFDALAKESETRGLSLRGARILIPCAANARDALPTLLHDAGALVDVVSAYQTIAPTEARVSELVEMLERDDINAIVFASPSAAKSLVALLGDHAPTLGRCALCSIGPITSATLRDLGLEPAVEAFDHTVDGLVNAIRSSSIANPARSLTDDEIGDPT